MSKRKKKTPIDIELNNVLANTVIQVKTKLW